MGYHSFQTAFTSGVLSPGMFSRVDFQKYANGLEKLENAVVIVTGGASRRAGSQFIASGKSTSAFQKSAFQNSAFQTGHNDGTVLRPFIFNANDAMVLEIGHKYIRFFKNREQVMGEKTGSELVTNGSFAFDLASWTLQQDNGGTVTWEAPGQAKLDPGPVGAAGVSQSIGGLVVGTKYVLNFKVDNGSLNFDIGSTLAAGDIYQRTTLTPGDYRLVFIATGATAVLNFVAVTPSVATRLDEVSLAEAVVLEIATPYLASDVRSLRFSQSADTMYITHKKYPPKKLLRLADALWTLQDVVFNPPPTDEIDIVPPAILTPSAAVGTGVTFTASASVFLAGDVGRQIKSRGGVAVITAFGSGTSVTADIIQPFLNANPIGNGNWVMDGSPNATATISAAADVNSYVTVTLSASGFRSSDQFSFLIINNWILEVVSVSSDTVVTAKVLKTGTAASLVGTAQAWTLEREVWSASQGYPECVAFHQQRLLFSKGQTFWGSRVGDFENMGRGPNNDDAYSFPIASGQVDVIRWMQGLEFLLFGTIGTEYKIDSGVDNTITPNTPPKASPQSAWGSDPVPDAVRAGPAVLFVQRGRQQIREMAKAFEAGVDAYQAADIALLANHLFQSGVMEMARTSAPASYLLAVLANGEMAVAAYERPENVVAWGKFTTDGKYKSICVIPNKCNTGDEVWALVERSGTLKVEVFDGQLNTDSALVYDNSKIPVTGIVGLAHLEAKTVDVIRTTQRAFQKSAFQKSMIQSPRSSYTRQTVVGGFVSVSPQAVRIEAGLHYDTTIKTLRIEVPTGGVVSGGTSHFRMKRTNTIYVRFQCSRGPGVFVDDEAVPEDNVLEVRDWSKQANLGWNREGQVTIKQTMPFPMTVLGVSYSYHVDDGDSPGVAD